MRETGQRPVAPDNRSYTPAVTKRTLRGAAGTAALLSLCIASGQAGAEPVKGTSRDTAEAARTAQQTAQAAADAADNVATNGLPDASEQNAPGPLERARQGVVTLERAGKVLGVGTVLAGDGRILTALSPLTHGNNVDARFADGSVARVKVGHVDRAWDLALLVPQNGRWKKGLKASHLSATKAGSDLRTFSVVGAKSLALSRTIVKGRATLLGGDSELLPDALELASHLKPTDLGSPIVDGRGSVVAVIAKACAPVPNAPCVRVPFGVPVSAVKAFLRTVPVNAVPPAPWLGIQGVADDAGPVRGVRVVGVHPQSPAAAAGLKGGNDKNTSDLVVAVDNTPVTTPEELAFAINKHGVGDSVQLLLFGHGKFRQATLTLTASPDASRSRRVAPGTPRKPARHPAPAPAAADDPGY